MTKLIDFKKNNELCYTTDRPINWTNGTEIKTNESIDGNPIYKKYVVNSFNGQSNVVLANNVDKFIGYNLTVSREEDGSGQWHPVNAYLMNFGENINHINPIFYYQNKIMTYITNTSFTHNSFYGFIYYTKVGGGQ